MNHLNGNTSATSLIDMLLRAADAWRNWRAMITLLATGVAASFLLAAGGAIGYSMYSEAIIAIFAVLVALVAVTGISAAGILLMDQALGTTSRGIPAALLDGAMCTIKWIAFLLIVACGWLAFLLTAATLLFACKIPGIGIALAVVVYPVLAIAATAMIVVNYFLLSLVGPALWSGATLNRAVAAFVAIVTKRTTAAVLSMAILIMIVSFVAVFVFGAVSAGQMLIVTLGIPILGSGLGFGGLETLNPAMFSMGYVNGLAGAIGMGLGIVYAFAFSAVTAVALMGGIYVYLHLSEGLDLSATEGAIEAKIQAGKDRAAKIQEDAKRRAAEIQEQAKKRAEESRKAEEDRRAAAPNPLAPIEIEGSKNQDPTCPKCLAPITLGDKFCGGCGEKLQ